MHKADLLDAIERLRTVISAIESGDLTAGPSAVSYLRGALDVLERLAGSEFDPDGLQ